jgi:hypothetical protein
MVIPTHADHAFEHRTARENSTTAGATSSGLFFGCEAGTSHELTIEVPDPIKNET